MGKDKESEPQNRVGLVHIEMLGPESMPGFDYDHEIERLNKLILNGTRRQVTVAKRQLKTLQESVFVNKLDSIFNRLSGTNWEFSGSASIGGNVFGISCVFYAEGRQLTEAETLPLLPIRDEEGNILPGFEVGTDEYTGNVFVNYDGPYTGLIEQVIDVLIDIGKPPEAPQS